MNFLEDIERKELLENLTVKEYSEGKRSSGKQFVTDITKIEKMDYRRETKRDGKWPEIF